VSSLIFAAVVALLILYFALRSRWRYLGLPELKLPESYPADADYGHVVIIPARNEKKVIGRAVRSLAGSTVLVVDDQSTDGTAEVAQKAGAIVCQAQPLQPGWLGKPNACWTGVGNTDSTWILFVDADTWFEPGFVKAAIAYAHENALAAISVFPRMETVTVFERMLLPYAFGLYFSGVNPAKVNRLTEAECLANGQCLLIRRSAYRFVGGHRAVAGSVVEDVALAQLLKRHRTPYRMLRAETLAHVRMYDSLRSIWRGFEKNSFRFLRLNPKTGVWVIAASIAMMSWIPAALALVAAKQHWALAGLFLAPGLAWWPWYRNWAALLAPIAILLFQGIALSGMFKALTGLKTQWKGRPV
jgi:cellulose synthase/poly-beta-1,6-N-acetylglucosamine synthase-like glycosyltransferase